jgi:cell division septum initiation protein DivIVA
VDVHDRVNELETMVRSAKAMPMSASCLVNRGVTLAVIEGLRNALPADLEHAVALLSQRDGVLAAGREQAEHLLEGARAERERLIEQADVLLAAHARAATVTAEARAEAARLLAEADDYVDRKLADFEVVLGHVGSQVSNGRERLAERRAAQLARLTAVTLAPPSGEGPDVVAADARDGQDAPDARKVKVAR